MIIPANTTIVFRHGPFARLSHLIQQWQIEKYWLAGLMSEEE